jgi:hypothetical protein
LIGHVSNKRPRAGSNIHCVKIRIIIRTEHLSANGRVSHREAFNSGLADRRDLLAIDIDTFKEGRAVSGGVIEKTVSMEGNCFAVGAIPQSEEEGRLSRSGIQREQSFRIGPWALD